MSGSIWASGSDYLSYHYDKESSLQGDGTWGEATGGGYGGGGYADGSGQDNWSYSGSGSYFWQEYIGGNLETFAGTGLASGYDDRTWTYHVDRALDNAGTWQQTQPTGSVSETSGAATRPPAAARPSRTRRRPRRRRRISRNCPRRATIFLGWRLAVRIFPEWLCPRPAAGPARSRPRPPGSSRPAAPLDDSGLFILTPPSGVSPTVGGGTWLSESGPDIARGMALTRISHHPS